MRHATSSGNFEAVKLLIAKRADVNAKTERGWTPLHLVKTVEPARLLIENGADVNARSRLGFTSLHGVAINDASLNRAQTPETTSV